MNPEPSADFPNLRVRVVNDLPADPSGDFILYWMIANRRPHFNFSLDRAVHWCRDLKKPLVVLEALRIGYRWASDRIHQFVVEGMADNDAEFAKTPSVVYYPYLEPKQHDGHGLLEAFAGRACVVVTDDFPCFFLPALIRIAGRSIKRRLEAVDSNGLLPMRAADQAFDTAFAFRRFLQRELRPHLSVFPMEKPLAKLPKTPAAEIPDEWKKRWPRVDTRTLADPRSAISAMEIDHSVPVVDSIRGGWKTAKKKLDDFVGRKLAIYREQRNEPDADASSGFSPYLHFGHLSSHQVLAELSSTFDWSPEQTSTSTAGKREGWWLIDPDADAFMDELVTWRELGYNMCVLRDDYDRYESLPAWAQKTLAEHENDPRPETYTLIQLERAETYDPIWNAAQRQLLREGRIHNYLRMLWGKKILQWSPTPREALAVMVELNNKHALDGRNPNSYTGILWCFGLFDRPWAPQRKVLGQIRYMSSANTAKKFKLGPYLDWVATLPQPAGS